MKLSILNDWNGLLANEVNKDYFKQLIHFLEDEYATQEIFPNQENLFSALEATAFNETQVVILGQDPYHGKNQAHGLSFSVLPGEKIPPSLKNMYKELASDLQISEPTTGYLMPWAKQGILLLNTVLTVRSAQPNSHKNKGWEIFTNKIIEKLNSREDPVIFVLWGKPAQQKRAMIDTSRHFIIEAPHPSPLSAYRGFFNSKPYSTINNLLTQQGKKTINWKL